MKLRDFIEEKITSNNLQLDVNVVYDNTIKLEKANYPHKHRFELFYIYLLQLLGNIILTTDKDDESAEMMGWLKVKSTVINDKQVFYFRFETIDDYYYWLSIRNTIYSNLDDKECRIVNFIELSTFDFISDNLSNCKYKIYKKYRSFNIQKTGMLCNNNEKFIKEIVKYFNKNYNFKPI